MIIKLTNATPELKDQPILINTDHIISMFSDTIDISPKTKELITTIYSITQQTWIVKESIDSIYDQIKNLEAS